MPDQPSDQREDWNAIAPTWDESIAEGNDFQKMLIVPVTDHLLCPEPGMRILDACCGNGNYSRKLGQNRCEVIAFDGSSVMIDRAKKRTKPEHGNISFAVADACDEQAVLDVIGNRPLDAAVSSMAFMDLPDILPLLRAVRASLKPKAPFVFSVGHPCFHSNEAIKWATQTDGEGEASQSFGVLVMRYISDWKHQSRGLLNQPIPHTMWHRPISTLLRDCFAAGFVVDALEEPTFPVDTRMRSPFAWSRRPEIPPVLVVRLR
jgi:SAM-dependent methyltransferase